MSNERKVDLSKTLMELATEGWTLQQILDEAGIKPTGKQEEEQENEREKKLQQRVADVTREIGIPAHIKGYRYVRRAIELAVEKPDYMEAVTKSLYPEVAKKFDTTSSRVERAIRHAIEVAWDRGNLDTLQKYFGYTISNAKGKPTNSEFIAMIADRIRMEGYGEGK